MEIGKGGFKRGEFQGMKTEKRDIEDRAMLPIRRQLLNG